MSLPYNNSNKQFLIYVLKWMGIYMSIGAVLTLVLPLPVSLLVALGVFFLLNFIRAKRMSRRAGVDVRGLFRSSSPPSLTSAGNTQYNPIRYYCMSCGTEHKEIACLSCGSKMKQVG